MPNKGNQNANEDSGKIFLSSQRRSGRIDTFTPINEEEGSGDVFTTNHHLLLSGDYVHESNWKPCLRNVKTVILVVIWIVCSCTLMVKNEKIHVRHHISIPQNSTKGYIISEPIISEMVSISLEGALLPQYYANLSIHNMHVWVQLIKTSYRPTNVSSLKGSDILLNCLPEESPLSELSIRSLLVHS